MKLRAALLSTALLFSAGTSAHALNKQGSRKHATTAATAAPLVNLSGYLFFGGFVFNPTYAARPDNTGLALLRAGLHLDLDLVREYLTLSYDASSFSDGSAASAGRFLPSEDDHIVGLLSTIGLPHDLSLTLAVHYEIDLPWTGPNDRYRAAHPDYVPGSSQSYVDSYARLAWERGPLSAFVALGGLVWNPSYAARPDNSGRALLRYVVHGEAWLRPWLALRLDLNLFTDRDENPLAPSELDTTSEVALRHGAFELRFIGEADLPLGSYPTAGPHPADPTPGLRQFYLALLGQWSFDVAELVHRH